MEVFFGRNQLPVIISFIICGVLSGIVYDLLKIKRKIFGSFMLVLFFDDLLFMLVCTVLITFNAFAMNDGNYKWYEIPCMITGFYIYRRTVSKLVIGICFFIIEGVKRIAGKLLAEPLKFVLKLARKKAKFLVEYIYFLLCYTANKRKMYGYRFVIFKRM